MTATAYGPLRILYVTAGFPFPLTSGFLRHYHFIRGLTERGHRVTLLSLAKPSVSAADIDHVRALTDSLELFVSSRPGTMERLLMRLPVPQPTWAARALAGRAEQLAAAGGFDVVLLTGKETYAVAGVVDGLPLAVDMCDATATRIARTADHASGVRRVALRLAAQRMRAIERQLLRMADATAYASVRDREETHGTNGVGAIIPNGVDADYWHRSADRLSGTPAVQVPRRRPRCACDLAAGSAQTAGAPSAGSAQP